MVLCCHHDHHYVHHCHSWCSFSYSNDSRRESSVACPRLFLHCRRFSDMARDDGWAGGRACVFDVSIAMTRGDIHESMMNRMASRGLMIWWLSGWVRYDPKHAGTNWSPYENCEYLVGLIVLIHELSSSRIQATRRPKFTAGLFLWPFFHLLSAPKLKLSRLLHLNIRTPRLLGCHWCTIGGRGLVAARVAKGLGCAGRGGSLKIHKLVTSWRILCIQWYYLGPAISKLQIRSWCRRRAYPCH